ncbi:hypothetical protein J7I80_21445 [Bacillus sp. ISL-41]|uniref:hypothetical protein n=1 Tax=Bacillus sp. ISL-41 TaxID=2819127 RepID=UPI001BEA0DBB|nr:hypothetical protein [Bacillus sp. ISL-41]MBT2644785.1 hypothetical protein [Bacillus sp. ISL-41]
MLDKIRALPEKWAFSIGLSLIVFSPIFLFLLPFGKWSAMVQALVWGMATLFILSAADKRHSSKKRNTNYVK